MLDISPAWLHLCQEQNACLPIRTDSLVDCNAVGRYGQRSEAAAVSVSERKYSHSNRTDAQN